MLAVVAAAAVEVVAEVGRGAVWGLRMGERFGGVEIVGEACFRLDRPPPLLAVLFIMLEEEEEGKQRAGEDLQVYMLVNLRDALEPTTPRQQAGRPPPHHTHNSKRTELN